MTNKDESPGDSRLAAFLAVHLVRQVLDEAYVIANAAKESGEPMSYLSMLKNLRNSSNTRLDQTGIDDVTFTAKKDNSTYDDNMDHGIMIVTSTPQKSILSVGKSTNDAACYIGQGDECYETQKEDQSTSVFINHLFDMSDVERIVICDDPNCKQVNTHEKLDKPKSYANLARNILSSQKSTAKIVKLNDNNSSFAILEDACVNCNKNKEEDVAFYVHSDTSNNIKGFDCAKIENNQDSVEEPAQDSSNTAPKLQNKDGYEYAYLTLNRDYEQSEETYPDLQDTKQLQEIDLGTSHKSEGDIITKLKIEEEKSLKATSYITSSASRRSSLARRCRLQGARFFACLRGWWKRKSPGKRKVPHALGAERNLPLPGLKRKSTSMINQRKLGSPSCSHEEAWKFNSVNENTVKSGQWHDYTFEAKENVPE